MKNNTWAVWGPLRLGGLGPGPAGPLDKTALPVSDIPHHKCRLATQQILWGHSVLIWCCFKCWSFLLDKVTVCLHIIPGWSNTTKHRTHSGHSAYILTYSALYCRLCFTRRLCVCLSVCLSVCLAKNYWSDLHENFTRDVSFDKEKLTKFLQVILIWFGSEFFEFKDFSTPWTFDNYWVGVSRKLIGCSWKFNHMSLDKKVPIIFKVILVWTSESGSQDSG